ncbi:MAG: molybdopterin molybdotransferase MoeA [Solirubrobacterales bacterium]|nr:molybdopterin molybdotransferase MoeA [Solirubrobacterales bacterium]
MRRRTRQNRPMFSIDEARAAILAAVPAPASEAVALAAAHGRVLAEDVAADHDVPPFANSAMDGYAVRGGGPEFRVVGESRAGTPYAGELGEGEAVVISTGAALPLSADAVVPIERVTRAATDDGVVTQGEISAGDHVRRPGEDLRAGEVVLTAGTRMTPAALGVAAGAGRATLLVARRPRVTIVATGDELVAPGRPLGPGQIHDSNALALAALAETAGAQVVGSVRAPDDRARTLAVLEQALEGTDLLLVSGGVSVGPHDHVRPALEQLGVQERFWRVALRPGKPTWFGTRGETLVIGLPGNPVSALVTFALFARPALAALQGAPAARRRRVTLGEPITRHPDRDQAVRVRLDDAGRARATGPQGSHVLSSMLGADGLAIVPRGEGAIEAGATVELESL